LKKKKFLSIPAFIGRKIERLQEFQIDPNFTKTQNGTEISEIKKKIIFKSAIKSFESHRFFLGQLADGKQTIF